MGTRLASPVPSLTLSETPLPDMPDTPDSHLPPLSPARLLLSLLVTAAFMFVLSSLFQSSRTATVVAFLYIFASGLIGELLLRQLMHDHPAWIIAVELIPGFALYR